MPLGIIDVGEIKGRKLGAPFGKDEFGCSLPFLELPPRRPSVLVLVVALHNLGKRPAKLFLEGIERAAGIAIKRTAFLNQNFRNDRFLLGIGRVAKEECGSLQSPPKGRSENDPRLGNVERRLAAVLGENQAHGKLLGVGVIRWVWRPEYGPENDSLRDTC